LQTWSVGLFIAYRKTHNGNEKDLKARPADIVKNWHSDKNTVISREWDSTVIKLATNNLESST
jgi:hypothetical protein